MKYDNDDKTLFRELLIHAFPAPGDLDLVIGDVSDNLKGQWKNRKAVAPSVEHALQVVIDWAEANRCLMALMEKATKRNPDHEELNSLVEKLQAPWQEVGTTLGQVESVLFKGKSFVDVEPWLDGLSRIRHTVCRIEPQPLVYGQPKTKDGYGTGFLVAPDLVITNWHVAERFWENDAATNVCLRFGCELDKEGHETEGQIHRLQGDWALPHSKKDPKDFALLRLDRRAADDVVDGQKRGFLDFKDQGDQSEAPQPLLILQHPDAAPLKLAIGTLEGIESRHHMRHRVNTMGGSSGSPCLDHDLKLMGIHYLGGPADNGGILASAILPQIEDYLSDSISQNGNGSRKESVEKPAKVTEMEVPEKRAFVVQPMGSPGENVRQRADHVFRDLIEPACRDAGFEAARAVGFAASTITEPIISALSTDPLVLVDLGMPPWNPNVMVEFGFRLATGRPIVPIADVSGREKLPLHLRDRRVVFIDPAKPHTARETLARSIRECRAEASHHAWECQFPCVEFRLSFGRPENSVFTYANSEAATVYGLSCVEDIVGRPVAEVDAELMKHVPKCHRRQYREDQKAVLGTITAWMAGQTGMESGRGDTFFNGLKASARIPLWFRDHRVTGLDGKVYWPVIIQHKFDGQEHAIVMRVIFVDITSWAAVDPSTRPDSDVLNVPSLFSEIPNYTYDLCLCYDPGDSRVVQGFRELLMQFGFRVWPPQNMDPDDYAERAIAALPQSRIAAVLVSNRGIGRWGKDEFDTALYSHCTQNSYVCVYLPDSDGWEDYVENKYQELFEDGVDIKLTAGDSSLPSKPVRKLIKFLVGILR